jgi:hypothetical protein
VASEESSVVDPQVSETVGSEKDGTLGHTMFVTPGRVEVQVGAVVSVTVTVAAVVAVFPHKSVAVHVRVTL